MGNDLSLLTTEEVANAVAAKGSKYEPYAEAVRENGVDGELLASLDDETELVDVFDELNITSKVHRKVLTNTLLKAQKPHTSTTRGPEPSLRNSDQRKTSQVMENPMYFQAAAEYDVTLHAQKSVRENFDKITVEIMNKNPKATYAGVHLILVDGQRPVSGQVRQSDGTVVSDRQFAIMSNEESVCYYLVHDPSRDELVRELPLGNQFGHTYVGHVLKNKQGARVGAVCQVAELKNEQDTHEQLDLMRQVAKIAEEQLEDAKALQARAKTLKNQIASYGDDDVILPSHGPVKAVTASQLRAAPINYYPSPEEIEASGEPRDSSTIPAYCRGLATEEERQHIPPNMFDAVDAAGMPRPPIGSHDMERVAAVESLGLHRMDPNGPVASSLRNLIATAAQLFKFPLAQISFHNHAKEYSFCPYSEKLTEEQESKLAAFIDEWLIKDADGAPFLGCRGRGNAVCNYAILSKRTFVVHDLWEDKAFTMYKDLQFIRSYVGCPIISADGHVIAILCMFDFKPRPDFGKAQELQAENVARIIGQTIENWQLRQEIEQLERERQSLRAENEKRTAPTGDVTFVFTDVQNSTLLWEQDAAAMEAALKVHDEVMRRCCAEACGYEITTEGDAFLLAFHDPVDAISFALTAQKELHWAPWPDEILALSDASDDPDKALRGLRVRMGVHHGPASAKEHEVTGRTRYAGQTVRLTKSTEDMCHGGQILVTVDAWRVASCMMESLGSPQVLDLGEHVLMTGTTMSDGIIAKHVLQLVPKALAFDFLSARKNRMTLDDTIMKEPGSASKQSAKGRQFELPITKRQLSASFHDAPYKDCQVTMVFVLSPGLEVLSDEVAESTMGVIGKLLRPLVVKTNGYECKEDRGCWMIAFDSPSFAVQFGLVLLEEIEVTKTLDDSIDRKKVVQIGVHSAEFMTMGPHPTTGRADYFGPVVNRAARVGGAASPGEVWIGVPAPSNSPEEILSHPDLGPSIETTQIGVRTLKGIPEEMALYSCWQV